MKVPDNVIRELENSTQYTTEKCVDSNRAVIKRSTFFSLLSIHWKKPITPKIGNQLVSICSRKLPKQRFTIQGASRFTYLLMEPNLHKGFEVAPAIIIMDFLWDKSHLYDEAKKNYERVSTNYRKRMKNKLK